VMIKFFALYNFRSSANGIPWCGTMEISV